MNESGWIKTEKLEIGSIIVWDSALFKDGEKHKHIGFYVGQDRCISNDSILGTPQEHDILFRGSNERKILEIYFLSKIYFANLCGL